MNLSNKELTNVIRDAASRIEKGYVTELHAAIKRFKDLGIHAQMHAGRGSEMDSSENGTRLKLEWFAGSLVDIADQNGLFAVNSWLNCVDRFAPEIK